MLLEFLSNFNNKCFSNLLFSWSRLYIYFMNLTALLCYVHVYSYWYLHSFQLWTVINLGSPIGWVSAQGLGVHQTSAGNSPWASLTSVMDWHLAPPLAQSGPTVNTQNHILLHRRKFTLCWLWQHVELSEQHYPLPSFTPEKEPPYLMEAAWTPAMSFSRTLIVRYINRHLTAWVIMAQYYVTYLCAILTKVTVSTTKTWPQI